jgi:hypothetical protein
MTLGISLSNVTHERNQLTLYLDVYQILDRASRRLFWYISAEVSEKLVSNLNSILMMEAVCVTAQKHKRHDTKSLQGKLLPALNQAPRHEDVCGSGVVAPPSLTTALYGGLSSPSRAYRFSPGQSRRYPLYRRLGGPPSRYGR